MRTDFSPSRGFRLWEMNSKMPWTPFTLFVTVHGALTLSGPGGAVAGQRGSYELEEGFAACQALRELAGMLALRRQAIDLDPPARMDILRPYEPTGTDPLSQL